MKYLIGILCLAIAGTAQAKQPPVRVLIVDGVNNHDWQNTTPVLKEILEESGRFAVSVSTSPPRGAPADAWTHWRPAFAHYDVVISDFNGGDHGKDVIMWPHRVERAFERYVQGGGGFVSFHAANNAFPGWKAYEAMVGLLWRPNSFGPGMTFDAQGHEIITPTGQGLDPNHPRRYDFDLTILDGEHPITRGLPGTVSLQSEQLTYGQHGPADVVRSGALHFLTDAWCQAVQQWEPMDWIRQWGKGRVYVTMLGHTWHDEASPDLDNAAFRTLFLRGTEWAATGKVTIPLQEVRARR